MAPIMVETAEGILDVEISKENGAGHQTMGDFVRHHMQSILKPFADHVDDLHKAVELLTNDLADTSSLATTNGSRLDRHDDLISDLRTDHNIAVIQAKATDKLLNETRNEKQLLEDDHAKTKRELLALEQRLQLTEKFIADSQTGLKATNANVEELKRVTRATNENIATSVETAISILRVDVKKLTDRTTSTEALLDNTKSYGEGVHSDLKTHIRDTEKQNLKNERAFADFNVTTKALAQSIRETDARAQAMTEQITTTIGMVRPLKIYVDQHGVSIQAQQTKHSDMVRELTDFMERFAQSKIQLDRLVDMFGSTDGDAGAANISDTVAKLAEAVSTNSADIVKMEALADQHHDALKRDTERLDLADVKMAKTADRVQKCEDRIGMDDPPPPPPKKESKWAIVRAKMGFDKRNGKPSLAAVVQMVSITQNQRKEKDKLIKTAEELERTKKNLKTTKEELKKAENRVEVLEVGLSHTNEVVSKLGAGLDLTQEYWSGLSKGMRDTHKAVAIDNELLPDRGSKGVTLPAIPSPQSPRAPGYKRPASHGGRSARQSGVR